MEQILCSLIAKDNIILVENSNMNSDLIMKVLKDSLKDVKVGTSSLMPKDTFNFAYLNENNITYALLTTRGFSKATVVGFLESIKKAFDLSFPQKDFKNIGEYGLNEKFQETLNAKINLFNANPNCSSEEIILEKEKLTKQKDELLYQSDYNYDRGDKLKVLQEKEDALAKDSSAFYKSRERKKKCIIF